MPNNPISPERLKNYQDIARMVETAKGSLSVSAFAQATGYSSTAAAVYVMKRMVDAGLLIAFKRGEHGTTYRVAEATK
jgi:hypothetical protein